MTAVRPPGWLGLAELLGVPAPVALPDDPALAEIAELTAIDHAITAAIDRFLSKQPPRRQRRGDTTE